MIEKILKQIVELDDNKPTQNNNYNSDEFKILKQLLTDAERCIDIVDSMNEYVSCFDLSDRLFVRYNKVNSFEKPSSEEIRDLIFKVGCLVGNLSNISNCSNLDSEIKSLSENIEILNGYIKGLKDELFIIEEAEIKKYNRKRNKLLSDLKTEIDNKKQDEEMKRKEFLEFSNSYDFSEDFVLFESKHNGKEEELAGKIGFDMPELTNFGMHNFSSKDSHNILFIKKNLKEEKLNSLFEDLFFRLLFHFNAKLLQVQPVGILPLKLNATLSYVKTGDYFPIKPAIIDERNFENYLGYVYSEVTQRINKYKGYKDFYEYNLLNPNNPDSAIVIFLYDYPQISNKICNMHIKNLLNSDCYLYGVYFIVSTTKIAPNGKNEAETKEIMNNNFEIDLQNKDYGFSVFDIKDGKILLDGKEVSFDLYDESAKELFLNKF